MAEVELSAPLSRAYEWIDGSAFITHILLVRRARGAEPPETLRSDPLVYQGASGCLLGPHDDFALGDPRFGLDFEAEVCVILGDTPRGTPAGQAAAPRCNQRALSHIPAFATRRSHGRCRRWPFPDRVVALR